jgi:hypothetical protein
MPATGYTLSAALQNIGVARVFMGDPFTVDGMVAIPTQGEVQVNMPQVLNRLTAPELTGEVAHDAQITPGQMTVVVPVIYGGAQTLDEFSAHGAAGDGYSAPRTPVYTSLLVIPKREMSTADPPVISYDGTTWVPSAPTHALWFWKTVPQRPEMRFSWEDGGRVIIPVTFEVFYDGARPSGHRLFTQGNPVTAGITTVRL